MEQISQTISPEERTFDTIRHKTWNEMYTAKKNSYYLAGYLSYLRAKKKKIRMFILLSMVIFITAQKFYPNSALFGLSFLAFFEIFKEIFPSLAVDENLIDRLPEYRMLYVQKFQKLELLYHKIDEESIKPDRAEKEYFSIKNSFDIRIEEIDNSIHLPEKKKIKKIGDQKADTYLDNIYDHLPK